jgi:hypothetical protein
VDALRFGPGGQARPLLRPMAFGLLAALGLLVFYLGVIILAQDWAHAIQQLAEDRWYVAAIAGGFGTQVRLFMYLRGMHVRAATSGVAASSGTSTAAMLACCAHHLVDVAPVLGLSGAVIFLNTYKAPLLWLGIAMNLVGIAYLLRKIRQQRGMACEVVKINREMRRLTMWAGIGMLARRISSAGYHAHLFSF